jgi:cytochrome c556
VRRATCDVLRATAVGSLCVAAVISVRAQQPSPPVAKPLVPVAASTLAEAPADYYGQQVSVVGTVEQALTTLAFTIDQDRTRATGKDVLILATAMNGPVEPNTYVTVLGEVVQFSDDIASRATVDLPPDLVAKYRGRPAVLATAILNASMVDLARRLPPPLTPAEQAFDAAMKRVGPAFSALRQAVTESEAAAAQQQAATLKTAVAETVAFWKTARRADALQWAADAQAAAGTIEQLSARGDWEAVKAAVTSLGQACQSCHGAYRERLEDGTYRMKTLSQ